MEVSRIFPVPSGSYFLFGPRGTGKSTLMRQLYPEGLIINLLLPSVRRTYQVRPEHLLDVVHACPSGKTIVIDEIQKVPQLLTLVHHLIEEKKSWQFVLTGSSSRKLKRDGVDLLGGRALKKSLHPFMASELGNLFDFDESLQFGLLPLRFDSSEIRETMSAYVSLYLEEEIKSEGLVRNIDPFAHYLEVLSYSHGRILNMSNIARECSIKRTTADTWLSIVEDLLIAFKVPIFRKRAKRILTSMPKFYFFDTGVYRVLRPRSVLDDSNQIDGAAIEGLVAQHLVAWIDYTRSKHELFFWHTKAGLEVDFVVFGEMGLWAIEVKNSGTIHPADLKGLLHFKEDYPESQTVLLYRGKETLLKNNILCMPCSDFLKSLRPNNVLF